MADMDPATLNRLEQGKGNPNLRTLERVAEALDVEVIDLLGKAQRRSSLEPSLFNGELEGERRAPTPTELHAIETLKGFCDRLERFLEVAGRKNIDATSWAIETKHAIEMAAVSLPLVEQEHLRPLLNPTAARLVDLADKMFDGVRDADSEEETARRRALIRGFSEAIA
jgi:transcriptional regulator with XRE-family HTH domain